MIRQQEKQLKKEDLHKKVRSKREVQIKKKVQLEESKTSVKMLKVKKIPGRWLSKYDSDNEIEDYSEADLEKNNIYEVEKILSHCHVRSICNL